MKLHVVTDGDNNVQAAFVDRNEARGYVLLTFEDMTIEEVDRHIAERDCTIP
jgi:hypothetical protein